MWFCREWRFELVSLIFVVGMGALWCIEYDRLRPACWAEMDLKAGQFLTIENLRGAYANNFVGTFLNRSKRKGALIESKDVDSLQGSQAIVALQVSEKQLPVSALELGTCVDAWSSKTGKIVASDLKVVAIGSSANAATSVLFSISRDEARSGGLAGGKEIAFAIVGCRNALNPPASPTPPAGPPPAPPKASTE